MANSSSRPTTLARASVESTSATESATIRLLLQVDRPLVRDGLRRLLDDIPRYHVIVPDPCSSIFDDIREMRPDVVLLDHELPESDPLGTAAALAERCAPDRPGLILVSDPRAEPDLRAAARAGVHGHLLRGDETWMLLAAIDAVAAGQAWLSPAVALRLLQSCGRQPLLALDGIPATMLSPRERSVIRLIALGRSNREIARELVVGETTVKTHVSRMLTKLNLRDRTQLAVFAHSNQVL
jgi:DNA-binding NarL/FixJ family response regulator